MVRLLGTSIAWIIAALVLFNLAAVIALNLRVRPDPAWLGQDINVIEAKIGPSVGGAMDEHIWGHGFPSDGLSFVFKGVSLLVEPKKTATGVTAPVKELRPIWIFYGALFLNFSYELGYSRGLFCFWTDEVKRCDNWL